MIVLNENQVLTLSVFDKSQFPKSSKPAHGCCSHPGCRQRPILTRDSVWNRRALCVTHARDVRISSSWIGVGMALAGLP